MTPSSIDNPHRNRQFNLTSYLALGLLLGISSGSVFGGDWKMWGGTPGRNMVSDETGIPDSFEPGDFKPGSELIDLSTTKNVKWVAKMGFGRYREKCEVLQRVVTRLKRDSRLAPYRTVDLFDLNRIVVSLPPPGPFGPDAEEVKGARS